MPQIKIDEWDRVEMQLALDTLRRYVFETVLLCLATTALSIGLMAFVPMLALQLLFAILGYVALILGVVQVLTGTASIIELSACLHAWTVAPKEDACLSVCPSD